MSQLGSDAAFVHGVRADDGRWAELWDFSLTGARCALQVLNRPEDFDAALAPPAAERRELALEAGRVEHAPSAPRRRSCIWMLEDSAEGRARAALAVGPRGFVLTVRVIAADALMRCDSRWLERVEADPGDADAVRGYWSGLPLGAEPRWEYLLDGQVASADPGELARLRRFVRRNRRRFGFPDPLHAWAAGA